MENMTVEVILKRKGANVVTTGPSTNLKIAAEIMRQNNIAALLVVTGDSILGIVTERDIVRAFARDGVAIAKKTVQDIMTTKLISGQPGDSVKHVMQLMTNNRIRHFPVIENGQLKGMVSIGDVVRHRLADLELEKGVLRDAYIAAR
jgi:CBS domain-containing protein